MKIRTQEDIDHLAFQIKKELGLDIEKYRNEEVAENFVELLVFPKYIFWGTIRPLVIAFFIFLLGFVFIDLVNVEYLIYGILGLPIFLTTGLLLGLLFLTWKMRSDLWSIVEYSLDILKSAISDLNHIGNKITSDNKKNIMGLLFKGIIHIVTIPMLGKVISDKVPLVGGLLNGFVKKILTLISDKIQYDERLLESEMNKKDTEPNYIEIQSSELSAVTAGLEKTLNFTFGVAQLPLKISFAFMAIVMILFLYFIW